MTAGVAKAWQGVRMTTKALTGHQITEAGLEGWAFLQDYGLFRLETRVHTASFSASLQLVAAIGAAAEELGHHADFDLRGNRLDVRLTSGYEAHGVTEVDVTLARRITELAAAAGASLTSEGLSRLELALDTPDLKKIAPFWAAVLGREFTSGDGWADVGDGGQVLPLIWFQPSGSEEPRQRWHLDVWVTPDQVQPRIDAALAAGGTLVKGSTLVDPDGNKVCLCSFKPEDGVIA
jgi:4a-hydroxytetrahydrobiopterin dehydratase